MGSERIGQRSTESSASARLTRAVRIPLGFNERDVLVISGILVISIFLFDISLAIGFVASILYVVPALICIWSPRRRTIFLVAGIASLLTILAVPLKPPGDLLIPLFNRPVSLLALWAMTFLVDLFVTERKTAEKAQREIQEDLNYAQQVSQTGSWRLNFRTGELLWSDETYRIFGIPKGTPMTYEKFLGAVHPDDREGVDLKWQAALRGEPYDLEHRITVAGEVRWVREKAVLEMNGEGSLHGGFGTVQDITERKRSREALKSSQRMLQQVLDTIPQRVIWKDLDLNYMGANRKAVIDAGLSDPRDIVGKNDHQLAWRGTADLYQADDREVITNGKPKLNFEEPQVQSDGRVMWLKTSKVPLRDAEGNIIGVLGTYDDITEQKRMEGDLKRSNADLQQFAYVSSHDLQEPLRMIISYLTLLDRKYKDELDPQAQQYIQTAVEGGLRMRALIDDLLEYSRIDTMAKPLAPVDMNKVVEDVLDNLKMSIEESDAEVSVERLPVVMADGTQMLQVFQNLITNAIKFHGAENPKIHVSASQDAKEWTFAVRDNGIGLNPEYADRIFQMFQRLHTKETYPGTGVGLAIAKKIVERHGGRIWVTSEDGKGAIFYFTIPKTRGKEQEHEPST